jgi:hypothetical protein
MPAGRGRGRCRACKALGEYLTFHRDHAPDDPELKAVKAAMVEEYRRRAELGLPLFSEGA